MGRVSQAQARENRRQIVETAARLFRERGVPAVSVADVMAEVGLTHGGFYKHFASKDALVTEAIGQAYKEQIAHVESFGRTGDPAALQAVLDDYLSISHRDDPGTGCPSTGFGADVARTPDDATAREAYAQGVERYAGRLGPDGLASLSTMVGAMVLSRATAGTELSVRILAEAKAAVSGRTLPAVGAK
ncbi:TetR/AcrR family transcriptional regulator [Actinoplanes sp. TBRC 11911]|uniref:TetR/AcrR family transcriptional regulator n=1 Tax=Actinoplanes sp. TBRC 11911 TaxID=2729386 RepID=UPI00145C54DA|nr:TetR/AcrR family transcriptional regulator [Actinoplanes sp. TBRC 11911]NMO49936.1 TetR/AcrR family transcriptional regulator [Actinoplanes sp. TBRC 11911]